MAVLPASKAYPRGGAPRRAYSQGAPLFAKMAMRFCGVEYKRGDALPVEQMSKHKHWELWMCGKADHLPYGPFDKRKAVAPDAVAIEPEAQEPEAVETASDAPADLESPEDSKIETLDVTPGESVHVRTPQQRKRR